MTATYADIRTRPDAEQFVSSMMATPLAVAHPDAMAASLREDAREEWQRASGSPLADAPDRSLGASLVLLVLNVSEGVQS